MSLRTWSLGAVVGVGVTWIVLVLGVALPIVMRWLSGRHLDGARHDGWSGVGFLPRELVIGVALAFLPPLLLLLAWAWARRPGGP